MENPKLTVAMATFLFAVSPAAAAGWLKDRDIAYVFAAREVSGAYSNGAPFTEIYHKDGTIDYAEGQTRVKGRWNIADGKFCTTYDGLAGGCFLIAAKGTNCFEFWLAGSTGATAQGSWIARGWQTKYPPTCPSP